MTLNRRLAATSSAWSVVLQWSRFGLNSVVFLLLTRLLTLDEIGVFAIAFSIVRATQVIQRSGLVETIVQADVDQPLLNALFWVSSGFGLFAGGVMFAGSYFIGSVFGEPAVGDHLAVLAVIPVLLGVSMVSEGQLLRALAIRGLALRSVASLGLAGCIAIYLGMQGHGAWALTAFATTNVAVAALWTILQARWYPTGKGSFQAALRVLPVFAAVSGRNVVYALVMPALQFIVGIGLGVAAAGAFQIAHRFLTLAETVAITPVRYVALPLFSRARENPERLAFAVEESIVLLSIISMPVYFGLVAIADNLLPLILGPANAGPTIPILQILLLIGAVAPITAISHQALTAVGRPQLALGRAVLGLVCNIGFGFVAATHSLALVAASYVAVGYFIALLIVMPVLRQFEIKRLPFLFEISKSLFASVFMAAGVVGLDALSLGLDSLSILVAQISLGIALYAAVTALLSTEKMASGIRLLRSMRRGS